MLLVIGGERLGVAAISPSSLAASDTPWYRRGSDLHDGGMASSKIPPAEQSEASDRVIDAIRRGDEGAFLETYREYYARLCDFAISYVHDVALAEDVVSDLFLGIWRGRETWHVTGSLRAYLFSAVRYRALNIVRDQRRHDASEAHAVATGELPTIASAPDEVAEVALLDDVQLGLERTVWEAVASLPERGRTVMTLRWQSGLSLDEIARVLGTTEMAVRQLHKRALAALRTTLSDVIE